MSAQRSIPLRVALLLQRVADGEASARDLARYQRLVDADPDLAQEVRSTREFSRSFQSMLAQTPAGVDFRAMQARVFQAVANPEVHQPSWWERLEVWLRESWSHRPAAWAPVTAVAAAAVLAVFIPRLVGEPKPLPQELLASRASEIHSLDTDSQTAVVFQTSGSGVTVIWLAGLDNTEVEEEEDEQDEAADNTQDIPEEVQAEIDSSPATDAP